MLILVSILLGMIISLLEAVCTGQVYLPVLVNIFRTGVDQQKVFLLILWYNLMFIVPLLAVFVLFYLGYSSEMLSKWLKNKLLYIKLLMMLVFFFLGAYLLINI